MWTITPFCGWGLFCLYSRIPHNLPNMFHSIHKNLYPVSQVRGDAQGASQPLIPWECSHGALSACGLCSGVSLGCGQDIPAQGTQGHTPHHRVTPLSQDCPPTGTNERDNTSSSWSMSYKLAARIFRELYYDHKHVPILLISAYFQPLSINRTTGYIHWSWQYVHPKLLLISANYSSLQKWDNHITKATDFSWKTNKLMQSNNTEDFLLWIKSQFKKHTARSWQNRSNEKHL